MSLTTGKILYHNLSTSSHWHIWQLTKMTVKTTWSHPHWTGKQKTTKPQIKCDSENCQIVEYGLIIHSLSQRGKEVTKTDYCPCGWGLLPQTWCEQILSGQHALSDRKVKMVDQTQLPNAKRKKNYSMFGRKKTCMFWPKQYFQI